MTRTFEQVAARYANHPDWIGLVIDTPNTPGAVDDTLMHLVARIGDVADLRDFVRLGGNLDQKGDMGFTPLHYAAAVGRRDMVVALLELGADRDILNEWDQTALEVAVLGRHESLFDLL